MGVESCNLSKRAYIHTPRQPRHTAAPAHAHRRRHAADLTRYYHTTHNMLQKKTRAAADALSLTQLISLTYLPPRLCSLARVDHDPQLRLPQFLIIFFASHRSASCGTINGPICCFVVMSGPAIWNLGGEVAIICSFSQSGGRFTYPVPLHVLHLPEPFAHSEYLPRGPSCMQPAGETEVLMPRNIGTLPHPPHLSHCFGGSMKSRYAPFLSKTYEKTKLILRK